MIIKVLQSKVPKIWDAIKLAIVNVNELDEEKTTYYLNKVLHNLLSGKANCFLIVSDSNKIKLIIITKIIVNDITVGRKLFVQLGYGYESSTQEEWNEGFDFVKQYARAEQCDGIQFKTRNPKVHKIGSMLGAKELYRYYEIKLGE